MHIQVAIQKHSAFTTRLDRVIQARQTRVVAEMAKLDPALPKDGSAFHLAHNWHTCNRHQGHASRRIDWLMKEFYKFRRSMTELRDRHWTRVYEEWRNANR
jgi:hypothetical protein